jgi:hypothetical protein
VPQEPVDEATQDFHSRLQTVLLQPIIGDGQCSLLQCLPAWDGNGPDDCFSGWSSAGRDGSRRMIV